MARQVALIFFSGASVSYTKFECTFHTTVLDNFTSPALDYPWSPEDRNFLSLKLYMAHSQHSTNIWCIA